MHTAVILPWFAFLFGMTSAVLSFVTTPRFVIVTASTDSYVIKQEQEEQTMTIA